MGLWHALPTLHELSLCQPCVLDGFGHEAKLNNTVHVTFGIQTG